MFRTLACASFFVLSAACSSSTSGGGSSSSGDSPAGDCKTGKNAPWATPAGTAFSLPQAIALEGEITADVDTNCGDRPFEEFGGEDLFVCVGLTNTSATTVTVTLPAGLTFIAKNAATQNGIILQSHALTVPTGTTYFKFALFCLNEHCVFGMTSDRFTFGNVTSDAAMLALIALAANKTLKHSSDDAPAALVAAVWDITDGDGVTADDRAAVDAAD